VRSESAGKSGSFRLVLRATDHQLRLSRPNHPLDANDCFINSPLRIAIKQFGIREDVAPHPL
jgi:hypothetical protein